MGLGQGARLRRVLDRIFGVQQFDQPFGRPGGALHLAPDFRQRTDSTRHHHGIDHELHQFARRHRPGPDIACADPQDADDPSEDKEDDDEQAAAVGGAVEIHAH